MREDLWRETSVPFRHNEYSYPSRVTLYLCGKMKIEQIDLGHAFEIGCEIK